MSLNPGLYLLDSGLSIIEQPLGSPLNVLLGIAYCRKGCILLVLTLYSTLAVFLFCLFRFTIDVDPLLRLKAINNPITTGLKQAEVCL